MASNSGNQLLHDIAHRNALTPEEYPDFEIAVVRTGIPVFNITASSVPYSDLEDWTQFGTFWWYGQTWDGLLPAISDVNTSRAMEIARDMAGNPLDSRRAAYIWNCAVFDPEIHFPLEGWLREHHLGQYQFMVNYRWHLQQIFGDRDFLVATNNPEAGAFGSRVLQCVLMEDKPLLEKFADWYLRPSEPEPDPSPEPVADPVVLDGIQFSQFGVFWRVDSDLPRLLHRPSGHALVLREPREVRFFGDAEIAKRGLSVNGYPVSGIEVWQDGWHGYFAEDVTAEMVAAHA